MDIWPRWGTTLILVSQHFLLHKCYSYTEVVPRIVATITAVLIAWLLYGIHLNKWYFQLSLLVVLFVNKEVRMKKKAQQSGYNYFNQPTISHQYRYYLPLMQLLGWAKIRLLWSNMLVSPWSTHGWDMTIGLRNQAGQYKRHTSAAPKIRILW